MTEGKSIDRGMVRAQLIRADVPPGPPADAENLEVKASKVKVPADETTYWCHVQKLPASLTRKHHVVEVKKFKLYFKRNDLRTQRSTIQT